MSILTELHTDIDVRAELIRAEHPEWLCRRGCEGCCHRLAEIPELTIAEWDFLREGLKALPLAQLRHIRQDIMALTLQKSRPIVCPLLDQTAGTCLVYLHRPVACRTYGFYVQRDKGLYCKDIESQVVHGALNDVVWGNQDAIAQRLKLAGETRALTQWFSDWAEAPFNKAI